ncbi:MAG: hypothetical protein AAGE52_10870 [Myxococcota bacterium]
MNNDELMDTLRDLLRDVLRARFEGAAYAKLARAHGYADGYMRALLDAGLVDRDHLLSLVGEERRRFVDEVPAIATATA